MLDSYNIVTASAARWPKNPTAAVEGAAVPNCSTCQPLAEEP